MEYEIILSTLDFPNITVVNIDDHTDGFFFGEYLLTVARGSSNMVFASITRQMEQAPNYMKLNSLNSASLSGKHTIEKEPKSVDSVYKYLNESIVTNNSDMKSFIKETVYVGTKAFEYLNEEEIPDEKVTQITGYYELAAL